MHFVAWVQQSLCLLTGISTLKIKMPSERKDNRGKKGRANREGGSNKEAERQ